jgi:hypothetical protein
MDKFNFFNRRKGYFSAEEIDSVIIPFADLNISDSAISRGFYMHNDEIHAIFSGYSQESNIIHFVEKGNIQTAEHDSKISLARAWTNCFSPDGLTVYNYRYANDIIYERKLNTAFTYSDGFSTKLYYLANPTKSSTLEVSDDGLTLYLTYNNNNNNGSIGMLKINFSSPFDLSSVISEEVLLNDKASNSLCLFGVDDDNNKRFISDRNVFIEKNGLFINTHKLRSKGFQIQSPMSVVNNMIYSINRSNYDDEVELYKHLITYKN